MRRRSYIGLGVVAAGLGSLLTTSLVSAHSSPDATIPTVASTGTGQDTATATSEATPTATALTQVPVATGPVRVKVDGFLSWALLNRRTGVISGSANLEATNSTESMIKIWIVSDFLRRSDEKDRDPSQRRLRHGRAAIIDSDDDAAQSLYVAGGRDAVVDRMIHKCRLSETKIAGPAGVGLA